MPLYCTSTDVLSLMPPNLVSSIIDPDKMEKPITEAGIDYYIEYASEYIDGALTQLYVVPLVKIITVNKADSTETIEYPRPIKEISSLLSISYIYQKLYSESQNPQTIPEYSLNYQEQAFNMLTQIMNGSIILKGQRQISRRYLRPESMNANRLPHDIRDLGRK